MSLLATPGLLTPKFFRPKGNWLGQSSEEVNNTLRQILLTDGNTKAWFRPGVGVTGALTASAWADQSGNGNNLLQGTAANQPIYLPFAGEKYCYLPGVVGNYMSTPDSASVSLGQKFVLIFDGALDDWTPTGDANLISKYSSVAGNHSYSFYVQAGGTLRLLISANGTADVELSSSIAPTIANGSRLALRVDYDGSVANATFYTAPTIAGPWTQLGTIPTMASATPFDGTAVLEVGAAGTGTLSPAKGKVYGAKAISGTFATGTVVFDSDFVGVAEGATSFTESSSNAATVTINSTGATPAQIVGSPSMLLNGAAHFMQAAFTLSQPENVYLVWKPITHTSGDAIFDGAGIAESSLSQNTAAPDIYIFAGTLLAGNGLQPALGSYGISTAVFNGASSSVQLNAGTAATGAAGAAIMSGITLGAAYTGLTGFSNIQVKELIVRSVADSAATRLAIQIALARKHGITL